MQDNKSRVLSVRLDKATENIINEIIADSGGELSIGEVMRMAVKNLKKTDK